MFSGSPTRASGQNVMFIAKHHWYLANLTLLQPCKRGLQGCRSIKTIWLKMWTVRELGHPNDEPRFGLKSALMKTISGAPKIMRDVRLKPDQFHGSNDGKRGCFHSAANYTRTSSANWQDAILRPAAPNAQSRKPRLNPRVRLKGGYGKTRW